MNLHSSNTALTSGGVVPHGSLDSAAKALVQILESQDPEDTLLGAINDGTIPGEIGLELAEVFGEIIRVLNLDNSVETVMALSKSHRISTPTEEVLFLAIIEMAEQEEAGQTEVGDAPTEVTSALIPAPLPEPTPPAPQAPTVDLTALVGLATELLREFGTIAEIPVQKLAEIRQVVEGLPKDKFDFLRQSLSSAILAQAELDEGDEPSQDLEALEVLFKKRQAELTAAVFAVYETLLVSEGFRLRDRDGHNRPLMTVTSIGLLRSRFRRLLDSREPTIAEGELAAAEKAVTKLEEFLLATWRKSVRESDDREDPRLIRIQNSIDLLQNDVATRIRERIISSGIRTHNAIASELVAALPQDRDEARAQVGGYLGSEIDNLTFRLRVTASKTLAEAECALQEILLGYAMSSLWRRELETVDTSYEIADQRPELTISDRRLALFEVERKELESILEELDEQIKASQGAKTALKKLSILRAITVRKLEDLDGLIAPLRPRPREEDVTINPSLASSVQPPPRLIPPPPPLMAAAPAQEVRL